MPISSGIYQLPLEAFPVNNTVIDPADYTSVLQDIATALNVTFFRDGSNSPTSAINWNAQQLTNVSTLGATEANISDTAQVGTLKFPYGSFIDNSIIPTVISGNNYLVIRADGANTLATGPGGTRVYGQALAVQPLANSAQGNLTIQDTDSSGTVISGKGAALATNGLGITGGQIFDVNNFGNMLRLLSNNVIGAVVEAGSISSRPIAESTPTNLGWWLTTSGSLTSVTANGVANINFFNAQQSSTQTFCYFNNGSTIGSIQGTTTTTAFNTTSDKRLKTILAPLAGGIATIKRLAMHHFKWKKGGENGIGGMAQDIHDVVPEAVTPGKGQPGELGFIPWGVDYAKIVPHLVVAMQELIAEVETLKGAK